MPRTLRLVPLLCDVTLLWRWQNKRERERARGYATETHCLYKWFHSGFFFLRVTLNCASTKRGMCSKNKIVNPNKCMWSFCYSSHLLALVVPSYNIKNVFPAVPNYPRHPVSFCIDEEIYSSKARTRCRNQFVRGVNVSTSKEAEECEIRIIVNSSKRSWLLFNTRPSFLLNQMVKKAPF